MDLTSQKLQPAASLPPTSEGDRLQKPASAGLAGPREFSWALIERLMLTAERLRQVVITDLIEAPVDLELDFADQDTPTIVDRRRLHPPLVRRLQLGEDPTAQSRDALLASIDAAAFSRLRELYLETSKGRALDVHAVWALLRCQRRLRAVAATGLFLPDYYAYQARIEGSPFTIFMHYLNEAPETAAQPNPLFNTNYYLISNKRRRGSLHPFIEYALIGRRHGATTHWSFSDVAYAQSAHVETEDAMSHCLSHYADYARTKATSELVRAYASADARTVDSFVFDPDCYARLYQDVPANSNTELVEHYLSYGESEGRIGCVVEHLQHMGVNNFYVPSDFDPLEYDELNPDVVSFNLTGSPLFTLEHYLRFGLREGRHYTKKAFGVSRSANNFGSVRRPINEEDLPVGIFVHMFYPDMWPVICNYLNNMCTQKYILLINLVASSFNPLVFSEIRRQFPHAQILVSPNEGRDIGGLFRLFDEVDFNELRAVAICHSKKSPHLTAGIGETWMRDLMDAYAETPEKFAQSLDTICRDPEVGIVASAKWRRIGVGEANDRHYRLIASLLPSLKGSNPEYPSGTMFLAKPSVVGGVFSALRHLEFESGDGLDLKLHIDGQIAHSVERAFGHMARTLGFQILWQ